ncbi:hypothetical protein DM39_4069 [Burkholderia cenocepacia]|uniref:Uncharacterized protein n=1 Tax=Burkholderia cenocepacia TaxID=95486 RepID=A0AAN0RYE7_9BURK|nr:hypothetical protein DM39_4069 [Burkholderia cenocepacia]
MMCFLSYVWSKAGIGAGLDNDLKQTRVNGTRKQDKRFTCQSLESYRASRCKNVSTWKDCDKRRRNKDLTLHIFDLNRPWKQSDVDPSVEEGRELL